jgi:hypothetical protein
MNAPVSRHILWSVNGRSVHAGAAGHELKGLTVHIMVRIQILVTQHLMIGEELYFYILQDSAQDPNQIRSATNGSWPANATFWQAEQDAKAICEQL